MKAIFSTSSLFILVLLTLESGVNCGLYEFFIKYIYTPIAAFAETKIIEGVDDVCDLSLKQNTLKPLNISKMAFQLRTPCKNVTYPLTDMNKILKNENFNPSKKLIIFVSGWKSDLEDNSIAVLGRAFHCRNDSNFMAIDTADYIRKTYISSAFNTEAIGKLLAESLIKLTSNSFPVGQIHLIGFSLGAHIVGYAGHNFKIITGTSLSRITGLDPANPCFNEVLTGLQSDDALQVEIIHTNPGGFGKDKPSGTIDFYVGALNPIQQGCTDIGCSHSKSYYYYAETVYPGNKGNFLGIKCKSFTEVKYNKCTGSTVPMGYDVALNVEGLYTVKYGGTEGWTDTTLKCSVCTKN